MSEESLREETAAVRRGPADRVGHDRRPLYAKPAVAVLGFDAPAVAGSSNQIVPEASARVSLRLAPGDDPLPARDALVAHLRAAAPWGVQVEIEADEAGMGYLVEHLDAGLRGGAVQRSPRRSVATSSRWGAAARCPSCRCSPRPSPTWP